MEDQKSVNMRSSLLARSPFKSKMITVGPIQEKVNLRDILSYVNQVFVLGEIGNYEEVTPCRFEWVDKIQKDCTEFDVNFEFLMCGTVFINPDGKEERYYGFNDMMKPSKKYKMKYDSKTKHRCLHEISFILSEE
jgi:protein gp37